MGKILYRSGKAGLAGCVMRRKAAPLVPLARLCGFLLAVLPFLAPLGCSRQAAQTTDTRPLIAVSILPQQWFVERVGGGRVRTLALAGPGQNPHNYEPSPKQISALAEAGAWILSGAEFEISLCPKIEKLFPRLPIVDGTDGLGAGAAKILAAHVKDTLSLLDPAGAAIYAENCAALEREIDEEFGRLRRELAPLAGRNVFVYHPSFGYFLDEFGIRQEAVETGGKEPGPKDLSRLIALAKQERAAAIFVQAQFPVNAAKTVAEAAGAELVSLDPLAPDWLANIRRMGEALQKAAGQAPR